ncbi:MAG: IPT/TIG domain-containing protein [Candidatus Eremiobacterota bacterium]
MKKYLFAGLLLLVVSSILFTGCGALVALVSSIFGSQGGFVFIPFLGDGKIESSGTGTNPGMIMLYTNNPPANYKALSGATVTIGGVSGNTNSDGSFNLTGIPVGVNRLTVEHMSYVSIAQDVPVSDPNSYNGYTDFKIIPSNHLLPIGIGGTFQFSSYATGSNNTVIRPDTTWSVTGDIGTIGSNTGIFTATKAGTGFVHAVSGSSSAQVPVTVVAGTGTLYGHVTYNNQPDPNATVYVEGFGAYVKTDPNGYYFLPGVPSTNIKVIGEGQTGVTKLTGTTEVNLGTGETKEANIVLVGAGTPTPSHGTPTTFPTQGSQTPTYTPTSTPTSGPLIPVINSVNPKPGIAGTNASISLSNMDPNATTANTTVTFGGTSATISSINISTSTIIVTIPNVPGEAPVVVTINGTSSASYPYYVNADPNAPTITGAQTHTSTSEIFIEGTNFGINQGTVRFNGTLVPVHSWINGTEVWTDYPGPAGTYQVVVITSGGVESAPFTFTHTP